MVEMVSRQRLLGPAHERCGRRVVGGHGLVNALALGQRAEQGERQCSKNASHSGFPLIFSLVRSAIV
jgi:hypothetical protein